MLGISLNELLVIAVIAIFLIGPKDLPVVLKTIGRYVGKVRAFANQFLDVINKEAGNPKGYIRDLEGKLQEYYEVPHAEAKPEELKKIEEK